MAWIRAPILIGLVLLWLLGTTGISVSIFGDCFGPPGECDPYHERMGQVFAFGAGLLLVNTAAALIALVWRSRAVALFLAVVATATAVVGALRYVVDGPLPHPIGFGFFLLVPGALFLLGAAVIELADGES